MKSVSLQGKKRPVSPAKCNDPNTDYRVFFALSRETGLHMSCECKCFLALYYRLIDAVNRITARTFFAEPRKKTRILPASASKIRVFDHWFELASNSACTTPIPMRPERIIL